MPRDPDREKIEAEHGQEQDEEAGHPAGTGPRREQGEKAALDRDAEDDQSGEGLPQGPRILTEPFSSHK